MERRISSGRRTSTRLGRLVVGAGIFWSLVGSLPGSSAAQAWVRELRVSQVRQTASRPPRLRVYLDLLDENRDPVEDLAEADFWATVGETPLHLDRVAPFDPGGEGVAYVFSIDVSRSLGPDQLTSIRDALEVWTASLGPFDRIALLSFGDESHLLADFTADRQELSTALAALRPSGERTVLHLALRDGLRLAGRRDPALPGRRALVLFSDGRDEGSGLTAEDVLAQLQEQRTPVYAIGSSRLRGEERLRHLDALHRFASNSGGTFFDAEGVSLPQAFSRIREAVRQVWAADFTCSACSPEGKLERFQIQLRQGGRVLSDGAQVRLLNLPPEPGDTAADAVTSPPRANGEDEVEKGEASPGPAAASPAEPAPGRIGVWLAAAAGLVVLGFGFLLAVRRLRSARGEPAESEEFDIPLPPPTPSPRPAISAASEPEPWSPPEEPDALADQASATRVRQVRFVVVRGSQRGREYELDLAERAVVGSGPACDCELDEPDIAPIQFELSQEGGRVMIRNLAPRHPTLLDGHPVDEPRAIRDRALVGGRSTILRVELSR